MREQPLHPFLRFRYQARVVERVGERNQTFVIIWTALPIIAGAAKPPAVRAEIRGIDRLGVAGEAVALQLTLREQPALRTHASERQRRKWRGEQRRFIRHDGGGRK